MIKDLSLKIGGMSCVRCASAVENALKDLKGIEAVTVSYATGKAEIRADLSVIDEKTISKAVKKAGYFVIEDIRTARKKEQKRLAFLFVFAFVLSLPFFSMPVFMLFKGGHAAFEGIFNKYIQFALATPVQIVVGQKFYRGAYNSLKNKSPGMDVLVALGTTCSYAYSVYSVFFGEGKIYFESSAVILTFVMLGKLLESRAKIKTSAAIEKLMDLSPKRATVIREGKEFEINASEIIKGDLVIVRPGVSLPADGVVVEGKTDIDESMLTGESIPVTKNIGDKVFGGTVNGRGSITFRAESVGADTVLSGIIKMVEAAQSSKADVQTLADKVAAVFVPTVFVVSLITLGGWLLYGAPFGESLSHTVAVLVVACPCSLGLATPTALMVGLGRGATEGILIKNANSLELACKIDAVVLDKTGTLTLGKPKITSVSCFGAEKEEILSYAASVEKYSEHPLASVITDSAVEVFPCKDFVSVSGKGVKGIVEGREVCVGNMKWISTFADVPEELKNASVSGKTLSLVAFDNKTVGAIYISDPLRDDTEKSVKALQTLGVTPVLVTGDNAETAASVAEAVGIKEYVASVLPEGKLNEIKRLKQKYKCVAMAGDGINDAPALAESDVGFSMGGGTDIAMESGDIVLMGGGISAIPRSISLSKATMRKIKQNLFWAFVYNSVGIPFAAFGILPPAACGAFMAFSSVSVVTNSLLLKRTKI